MKKLKIHADGICEPNPGKAAWAFIVFDETGEVFAKKNGYLGDGKTNNYAEYTAVGKAALWCVELACGSHVDQTKETKYEIEILSDSMLVVNQVNGSWECHDKRLCALRDCVKELFCLHGGIALSWVRGTENQADVLTRHAYRDATGFYPMPRVKKKKTISEK